MLSSATVLSLGSTSDVALIPMGYVWAPTRDARGGLMTMAAEFSSPGNRDSSEGTSDTHPEPLPTDDSEYV